MNATLALAGKDLKLLVRDKAGLFFTFVFPIIYALFFGSLFQRVGEESGGAMDVVVVDEDKTDASRSLVKELGASRELHVHELSRADATERVRRGKMVAYIAIPAGFARAEDNRFAAGPPTLEVSADPSRAAEAGMLRGVLMQVMAQRVQRSFADPAGMRRQIARSRQQLRADPNGAGELGVMLEPFLGAVDLFLAQLERTGASADTQPAAPPASPFRGFEPAEIVRSETKLFRHGPDNAYEVSFPQAMTWGVLSCAAGFALSLVVERVHGTLARLRLAPISVGHVLAGKGLACFLTILGVCGGMIAFGWLVFGVKVDAPGLMIAALLSVGVCFSGIMMVLSVLGRTEQSAGGVGWAIMLVMAMAGGGMVPVFMMPQWMQQLSDFSPVKWAIVAFEGPIWREYAAADMIKPCGILIAVGVVGFAAGASIFARRA